MAEQPPGMNLEAIGIVRNDVKQPVRHGWSEVVSDIVIDSRLAEALDGLDEFSHLIVLYWMHQLTPGRKLKLKVHPMGKPELPLVGRFATRSPLPALSPMPLTAVRMPISIPPSTASGKGPAMPTWWLPYWR